MRNGIVQAAGFPPAMECAELMFECAIHYNAQERQIIAPDGRVLAHLGELAIQETFGIPNYNRTSYKTKEDAKRLYEDQLELYATNVNKSWLEKPRPSLKKVPKKLLHTNFKEDYGDIILLLNRVISVKLRHLKPGCTILLMRSHQVLKCSIGLGKSATILMNS